MKIDLILAIQNNALADVLSESPTFEYFYRRTCRQYSDKFNTPLPQVYALPFDEVLRDMSEYKYESILQDEDGEEDLLEMALKVVDPNYEEAEEEDNEAFAKRAMEEENLKKAKELAKSMNLGSNQPQPLPMETPSQVPVGNSTTFDDETPPEAYDGDNGLDDL